MSDLKEEQKAMEMGLEGIKAKVVSQSIACTPGCPVTEKAVFTDSMWEG